MLLLPSVVRDTPTQSLGRVDPRDPRRLKLTANGQNGEVLMGAEGCDTQLGHNKFILMLRWGPTCHHCPSLAPGVTCAALIRSEPRTAPRLSSPTHPRFKQVPSLRPRCLRTAKILGNHIAFGSVSLKIPDWSTTDPEAAHIWEGLRKGSSQVARPHAFYHWARG